MKQIEDQRPLETMLDEFQATFQTPNTPEFWAKLVREERDELLQAAAELLKEFCDLGYVIQGFLNANDGIATPEMYELLAPCEKAVRMVETLDREITIKAAHRLHYNNMSKVQPDGTVKRREDGKVLKPEGFVPLDLTDLVR